MKSTTTIPEGQNYFSQGVNLKSNQIQCNDIKKRIYTIRGLQVMMDRDIACLYGVKSIRLREQVQRNRERFPEDFMFQLSENEVNFMVSQKAIPSKKHLGGSLPYVFTEQGVASLSAVIKSKKAVEIHVKIMRTFVEMRRFIQNNAKLFVRLHTVERRQVFFETETEKKFEKIFQALDKTQRIPEQGIFYNGQIYDAYAFVCNLIRSAKKSLILLDNYIDDSVLTLLSKSASGVSISIYTKKIAKQLALDLKKYNEQYTKIQVTEFPYAHDRFLIIDEKEIYHIGASLKDLGKKWFAFSKLQSDAFEMLEKLKR